LTSGPARKKGKEEEKEIDRTTLPEKGID